MVAFQAYVYNGNSILILIVFQGFCEFFEEKPYV